MRKITTTDKAMASELKRLKRENFELRSALTTAHDALQDQMNWHNVMTVRVRGRTTMQQIKHALKLPK